MRGRRRGYSFSALSTSIYISLSLCASENSTQQPSNMEIAGMTASTGTAGIKVYSSGRPLQVQRTGEAATSSTSSTSSSTAPLMRRREFYCEEIHHRTKVSLQPLTTKELVDSARLHVFHIFYFILLVLAATFVCIVTEGDVPLVWILPVVAAISLLSFHQLKL